MVDMLRQRIERAGIANLEAVVMDMEKLEFPDESFDAVTARWAFMFAPDAVGAIAAARRVLKPGGRLATATWDKADQNWWQGAQIFEKTLNPLVPPPPPDPNAPNPLRFSDPELLEQMLRDAGFADVSSETVPFRFDFGSSDEWWRFISTVNAPVAARLRRLDAAQLDQVRQESTAEIERFASGDRLALAAACLCAVGRK
jgi:SAM-dependent methyltransferase